MGQLIRPSRTAQYPLVKEFTFNFNDFVVDAVTSPRRPSALL